MNKNILPKHIAIIMDGNGRWAESRGKSRSYGHEQGAKRVDEIIDECSRLGIGVLSLYVFSMENWQRPSLETNFLMSLLDRSMSAEEEKLMKKKIRLKIIGFPEFIPEKLWNRLQAMERNSSQNTGLTLNLALSYGARQEIVAAVKSIASQVKEEKISVKNIDAKLLEKELFTRGLPDPDLLIRTGGDQRISNYLLWQIAYTEFYFTQCFWPDFTVHKLQEAIKDFQARDRRFGTIKEKPRLHADQSIS